MKILFAMVLLCTGICVGEESGVSERKVVVFDFGGVLGRSDKEAVAKATAILLDLPVEEVAFLMKEISIAKSNEVPVDRVWDDFSKKSGKILPDDWTAYFDILKMVAIRPNARVLGLVKRLKMRGYRLAIISNVTSQRARYIRKLGIYDDFDPVILSCDVGVQKPDSKIFQILLERAKTSPEECLFIDNEESHVEAARKLGFDTIRFSTFERLEKDLEQRGLLGSQEKAVEG